MIDVHRITVGPLAANCYLVRRDVNSTQAILVDPGAEAGRVLSAVERLGVTVEAILVTHCHVDHVGAVAAVARDTGAAVHCAKVEAPILASLPYATREMPARMGPFEAHDPEVTLSGGESLELGGLAMDVYLTPGHSPGHLVFAAPAAGVAFSGDILFAGAIGYTDAPSADPEALRRSLRALLKTLDPQTTLYPGHADSTTPARELALNAELAALVGEDSEPL